jgi:MscS family membrane protein
MEVVAASGTGFTFPSTTTYLARDGGIDAEEREGAERAVADWRAQGRLMFPEYADEEIRSMAATLDWPPRGSSMSGRSATK